MFINRDPINDAGDGEDHGIIGWRGHQPRTKKGYFGDNTVFFLYRLEASKYYHSTDASEGGGLGIIGWRGRQPRTNF